MNSYTLNRHSRTLLYEDYWMQKVFNCQYYRVELRSENVE